MRDAVPQKRQLLLSHVVSLAGERDDFAREEGSQDTRRLREPRGAREPRQKRNARAFVLAARVAGSEAELEAAAGQLCERGCLVCQHDRVAEVVVEDERSEADPAGRARDHRARRQRRVVPEVVSDGDRCEAERLEPGSLLARRRRVASPQVRTERRAHFASQRRFAWRFGPGLDAAVPPGD